ncbi:MAG: GGDEF domain-containing protein [Candidatus Dormibacteraceae bacterium]
MEESSVCWFCGGGLPPAAAFCPGCGHSQTNRESSPLFVVDSTTGLFNAVFLQAIVDQETNRARRYRRPLAVVVLEIDEGEVVARELGPKLEPLLTGLAALLNATVRDTDTVGLLTRHGSPRFAIVLPETELDGAVQTSHKIRAAVAAHEFEDAGRWRRLTMSCGASALNWGRLGAPALLTQAVEVLQEGRAAGPDRTHAAVPTPT